MLVQLKNVSVVKIIHLAVMNMVVHLHHLVVVLHHHHMVDHKDQLVKFQNHHQLVVLPLVPHKELLLHPFHQLCHLELDHLVLDVDANLELITNALLDHLDLKVFLVNLDMMDKMVLMVLLVLMLKISPLNKTQVDALHAPSDHLVLLGQLANLVLVV